MNRGRTNRRILIAVGVGAVLVVAGVLGLLGPLRWVYDHTLVPVSRSLASTGSGVGITFSNLGNVRNLAQDNSRLQQENAKLRQRLAADADTRRDNDALRRQLGLDVAGSPGEVAAEVVAFQPDSYRQFVTINKGSSDGIKVGQGALSDGVLVGVVSDIASHTAKLALVTDPEFKLTAKDQDSPNGALGVLQGQLGSGLVMDKIGQTDVIKPGDTITSAGLGGLIPSGLYIGQVQSVNTRANAIFQSAQVSTTVVPSHLRFVFVVLGP
jgi:rod shape-determining protein MreC